MASGVRLAPSFAHGLRRLVVICAVSGVITAATIVIAGAPSPERPDQTKADQPYGPTFPFGLVQFVGQGAILSAGVYVARRWFRVRL